MRFPIKQGALHDDVCPGGLHYRLPWGNPLSTLFDRQRERFQADPSDLRAFEALEESLFVAGDWNALVELYRHRLTAPDLAASARERARVLLRLGQILTDRLDDPERGAETYHAAIKADPTSRAALTELRGLHARREQWEVALQIAEVESDLAMSSEERAGLFSEVGGIWLHQLGDPEQALDQFRRALVEEPSQMDALEGSARANQALRKPAEAAVFWEQLAARHTGKERATALVAWAGLLTGSLNDPIRAADLYRRALTHDPANSQALEALAAIAEAGEQWELLVDLYKRAYALTNDSEQRAGFALAVGRVLLDQLANADAARDWLKRAAELDGDDARVHRCLADVERIRGDDAALLDALQQQVECSGDRPPVSSLLEIGSLLSAAGYDEEALTQLQRGLGVAPENSAVLEEISTLLSQLGRHEELVDVMERRAALATSDPATYAIVLAELGELQEKQIDDIDSARQTYERAMQANPTCPGVAESLERVYRKTEAWGPLRGLLEQTSRSGSREDRAAHLSALGSLLDERFEDRNAAARAFESALTLDGSCREAHRGHQRLATSGGNQDAILEAYENEAEIASDPARLGQLVREMTPWLEARERTEDALGWANRWITMAPEDADALSLGARLRERIGQDEELMDLLQRLDPLLQNGEQAANRRRIGALHAAHERHDHAIDAYRSGLEVDPADVITLEALVDALEQANRTVELAAALQKLTELLPEDRRAASLDDLSRLLEERLGDLPGAIDALVRLSEIDGAAQEAETRLEPLLERAGRFEELVERLERRIDSMPQAGEAARALRLRRAGVVLEHLSRFEEAVEAYRSILAENSDCDEAREGLGRGLRASGDAAGLVVYLAEEIERHVEPATRDRLALERAIILEEALDRTDEAIEVYRRLSVQAQTGDECAKAGQRLEILLERCHDWAGLRQHWSKLLESRSEAAAGPLHVRLGQLCRDRLHDGPAAAEHYEAAAATFPMRVDLWQALAHLYEAMNREKDLARVLEAELATGEVSDRELAIRSQVAQLCVGALEDAERARKHYARLIELDPGHAAAGDFLIEAAQRDGRIEDVALILEGRLECLDALPRDKAGEWAARRISLRVRIAGLRASQLDDPDGAIAVLEPGLGEIGPRGVVAEPLADLYQRAGYPEDLSSLCQQAADECEAGPERASWNARLGDTLRDRGMDREATEAYRKVLVDQPEDHPASAALRDLYRRLGEAEPLTHLLDAEISGLAGPDEIPPRLELATLLNGPLDRPADALLHLRRVVHIDPGQVEALDAGLEIAERLGLLEVTSELLGDALSRPQPPSVRSALLTRRARLQVKNPDRAIEAAADFREALALDPTQNTIRRELGALLESLGEWEGMLDCLYQQACNSEPQERAVIFERAVDIAWRELSPEAARPWLERLQHERPNDGDVLARIAEVHKLAGRSIPRLRAIEQRIQYCDDAETRRDLQIERARIFEEELESPGRAVGALEEARAIASDDVEILRHLDRLHRSLGRDPERARVLEALIEVSEDRDRASLICEVASLYTGTLKDPGRAAQHLIRAVSETPKQSALYPELLKTLGEALLQTGPIDSWARCAEAELAAISPEERVFDERRFAIRRELAQTYRRIGRRGAALEHLRRLADESPDLFSSVGDLELQLLDSLRAAASWVELERRLTARLDRHPDDAGGWLELARLREEKLYMVKAAGSAYAHVLEIDATSLLALRGIRGVAQRLGNWNEVARSLESELERTECRNAAERSALLRRLGDICWKHLHSTTRASRSYAAALEANPEDFKAHRSLERLLEAMEDWRGALDLYESEVEMLGDREPERRQEAWLRAGEIARDQTRETVRARRAFKAAADLGTLPPKRRLELADLHRLCGEIDEFAQVFASWCDDPETQARAADHLRLAETLEVLGKLAPAQHRAERATAMDVRYGPAWDACARLREATGDPLGAAEALVRASELTEDGQAASRLVLAARLRVDDDTEAAAELLRRAAAADPASAAVQTEIALLADRRGAYEEAETAAARSLDLLGDETETANEQAVEVALVGGRAARTRQRLEEAVRFFSAARDHSSDSAEALAGLGETLSALGDWGAARSALEARLALSTPYSSPSEQALHQALLARCLDHGGHRDEALQACEAALAANPRLEQAHELCVSLHLREERLDAGVSALERWAETVSDPGQRARHLIEAAKWEIEVGGLNVAAERHLRDALESDIRQPDAWVHLTSLLWDQDRIEEALEIATQGLMGLKESEPRGALALICGRAWEHKGDDRQALDAYEAAAAADPTCVDAIVSHARLLRATGDWREAADALDAFSRRHPGGDAAGLAEVYHQLGRLLAGPLEEVDEAIDAYRKAVKLQPEHVEFRTTLAQLLSYRPDDWREALAHYCNALDRDPIHVPSLRAVIRIAENRGRDKAATDGRALLRAMGVASGSEVHAVPEQPAIRYAADGALVEPLCERLRLAIQKTSREIGDALGSPGTPPTPEGADALARFRSAQLAAESRLTSAVLLPLSNAELTDLFTCIATVALEPDEVHVRGTTLNALSESMGRMARRRVRRALGETSIESVAALDIDAWRCDLRSLAAATALDEGAGTLRTALLAFVCDASECIPAEIGETADLTALIDGCPEARALIRRVVRAWLMEV